jgi:phosphopantothenoylcysteine decarboxylase/phosphopantothenate--cysteine ligase
VERLQRLSGWDFVGPVIGEVASGETGLGRMAEPEAIAGSVVRTLTAPSPASESTLAGLRVVVTAGPTIEDLDPVRALTNRSSGKMGFAIAESAARRGARVDLIAGPVALATPPGVERVDVRSALDMQAALARALGDPQAPVAALVMCAAVADYRARQVSPAKLKRSTGNLTIELVPNPDLLAQIGASRTGARPFLLGFAVETEVGQRLVAAGRAKLAQKRVDAIVANAAADALGTDETRAVLVSGDGEQPLGPGSKRSVADQITAFLASRLH